MCLVGLGGGGAEMNYGAKGSSVCCGCEGAPVHCKGQASAAMKAESQEAQGQGRARAGQGLKSPTKDSLLMLCC